VRCAISNCTWVSAQQRGRSRTRTKPDMRARQIDSETGDQSRQAGYRGRQHALIAVARVHQGRIHVIHVQTGQKDHRPTRHERHIGSPRNRPLRCGKSASMQQHIPVGELPFSGSALSIRQQVLMRSASRLGTAPLCRCIQKRWPRFIPGPRSNRGETCRDCLATRSAKAARSVHRSTTISTAPCRLRHKRSARRRVAASAATGSVLASRTK